MRAADGAGAVVGVGGTDLAVPVQDQVGSGPVQHLAGEAVALAGGKAGAACGIGDVVDGGGADPHLDLPGGNRQGRGEAAKAGCGSVRAAEAASKWRRVSIGAISCGDAHQTRIGFLRGFGP